MKNYPDFSIDDPKSVDALLRFIVRERRYDVQDFSGLQGRFMAGRKVGKVPSSSADVADTDRLGDFNYDADYLYIVVDDSGAAWRRIALSTW